LGCIERRNWHVEEAQWFLQKPKLRNSEGLGFSLPLCHSSRSTCSSIVLLLLCARVIAHGDRITQSVSGCIQKRNWHVEQEQ
jgi:hypothetical protein